MQSGLRVSTVSLVLSGGAYDQIACQDLEDLCAQTSAASEHSLKHLDE